MKEVRQVITALLNSNISTYEISKKSKVAYTTLSELRNNSRSIDNMKFYNIELLYNYAKEVNKHSGTYRIEEK